MSTGYSRGWQRLDDASITNVTPAPPRPPRLAALMSNADGYDPALYTRRDRVEHFSSFRLRWCAFSLVVATAMQASIVGSQLQLYFGGQETALVGGAGRQAIGSVVLLTLLLIALWSLLSQLLLWSDSAVMKLPEHMRKQAAADSIIV